MIELILWSPYIGDHVQGLVGMTSVLKSFLYPEMARVFCDTHAWQSPM